MRLSLFILGVFAVIVCTEKPTEAQNGGWCAYYNYAFGGQTICGFVTLQQCLADVRGLAGTADPVRTTSGHTTSGIDGPIRIDRGYRFSRNSLRLACNAALHYLQEGVMEFAAM